MVVLSIIAILVALAAAAYAFTTAKKLPSIKEDVARLSTDIQLMDKAVKELKEEKQDVAELPKVLTYNARKKTINIKGSLTVSGGIASGAIEEE